MISSLLFRAAVTMVSQKTSGDSKLFFYKQGSERQFIEENPVKSYVGYGLCEVIKLNGFHDITVHSEFITVNPVLLFIGRCENHDGQRLCPLVRPDSAQDFNAVDFRKLKVKENHFGRGRVIWGLFPDLPSCDSFATKAMDMKALPLPSSQNVLEDFSPRILP